MLHIRIYIACLTAQVPTKLNWCYMHCFPFYASPSHFHRRKGAPASTQYYIFHAVWIFSDFLHLYSYAHKYCHSVITWMRKSSIAIERQPEMVESLLRWTKIHCSRRSQLLGAHLSVCAVCGRIMNVRMGYWLKYTTKLIGVSTSSFTCRTMSPGSMKPINVNIPERNQSNQIKSNSVISSIVDCVHRPNRMFCGRSLTNLNEFDHFCSDCCADKRRWWITLITKIVLHPWGNLLRFEIKKNETEWRKMNGSFGTGWEFIWNSQLSISERISIDFFMFRKPPKNGDKFFDSRNSLANWMLRKLHIECLWRKKLPWRSNGLPTVWK